MNRERRSTVEMPPRVGACWPDGVVSAKGPNRTLGIGMALGMALALPFGAAQAQLQPPAQAQLPGGGPPSAQAALETLLNSTAGQPSAAPGSNPQLARSRGMAQPGVTTPSGDAAGRVTVTVARGQSLDVLLRQHLAASPLRVELLRELVRQLNPQAFAPGAGYRLVAGARLQLPSSEDQLQHAFGKLVVSREAAQEAGGGAGSGATSAARRGWVRYP